MELDYKAIGKRIKIARIKADLTQEALAEMAGLSTTHMSNIETGSSKLSLPMIIALANALSVSVDEFLCDNVIRSKEIFSQEIQTIVADCDDYEIRILSDLLKAAKDAIRKDAKLRQKE
ncbi:helix-turn-helix domain-containing protein [Candidatus Avoscillospira sp. LCP25S3_F1]|uniref:helix-turn-helix domain-containing protein n=1 Tax=Candidatus Avoscillospira sp. LCP25S3_F1 TaxID=3438825 RepID=UPI003F9389F4